MAYCVCTVNCYLGLISLMLQINNVMANIFVRRCVIKQKFIVRHIPLKFIFTKNTRVNIGDKAKYKALAISAMHFGWSPMPLTFVFLIELRLLFILHTDFNFFFHSFIQIGLYLYIILFVCLLLNSVLRHAIQVCLDMEVYKSCPSQRSIQVISLYRCYSVISIQNILQYC